MGRAATSTAACRRRRRSNYALREAALALRGTSDGAPTAVLTHGANPGLVSHFVKQALLDIATDIGCRTSVPTQREDWARLAQRSGVRVIHIAERDTQVARRARRRRVRQHLVGRTPSSAKPANPPSWAGAATNATSRPTRRGTRAVRTAAIYLQRPGCGTRVRTWTPLAGRKHAFLITHGESISIADYLTLGEPPRARLPADRALRLPPLRRRGAVAARTGRAQLAACNRARVC